jgi:hypothetical protein
VRYMYDEFDALFKDTWANIKSKSFEYRQQIIEQYLKENPPGGAVWVYTAKGLPKDGTIVLCEYKGGDLSHMEYLDCNKDWWLRNVHRWLNESPTAAGDGKEDEAKAFVEWTVGLGIVKTLKGWHRSGFPEDLPANCTTSELYTIFKNRNNKP